MTRLIYDPRDSAVIDDPLPVLKALQDDDPVHWSDILGGWVITRYDDVRKIMLASQSSADRLTPFYQSLPEAQQNRIRDLIHYLNTWVAFKDPPEHGRLRSILNAVFVQREIESLRPRIEQAVDRLLDDMEEQREVDFIAAFAFPLPATVIMFLCGLPPEDMDALKGWSEMMKPFIGSATSSPDKYDQAQRGAVEMAGYFREVVRARRREPGSDIISKLVLHKGTDPGLTEDEIIGCCMLFLFGGHETTTNLISNGMRALMRFPDARAQVLSNPELIRPAVEEILRFDGPTGGLVRVVKESHEFRGRTLEAGQRIFAMVHAGNHDARKFELPERFDIQRSPNHHLTFNYGPHFCLGAPLARLEGQIALGRLVARFPGLELTAPVKYMDTLVMRGVCEMACRIVA